MCLCVCMYTEDSVTEDMLVTHFLIQPDPQGVKLQGWSEKPFSKSASMSVCEIQQLNTSCLDVHGNVFDNST